MSDFILPEWEKWHILSCLKKAHDEAWPVLPGVAGTLNGVIGIIELLYPHTPPVEQEKN